MANPSSLIVGTGVLGRRLYNYLGNLNHDIVTISKSEKDWSNKHHCLDLLKTNSKFPQLPQIDYLFIVLTPSVRDADGYRAIFLQAMEKLVTNIQLQQNSVHCVFISSISVYGKMQRGIIDERIAPIPDNFRGKVLLNAADSLSKQCSSLSIVHAAGLYSNKRQKLIDSLLDENKASDPKYLNLIHEEDLCQWIWQAAKNKWPVSIAADGAPFQRRNVHAPEAGPKESSFRVFRSQYLSQIQLQHPSFLEWLSNK